MTDRLKGLTVAFTKEMREDDAEYLIKLISALKGVSRVTPILSDPHDWLIKSQVKEELREIIFDWFKKL